MKKIINTYIKTIWYYILLLLGLAATSWIIWSRFLRERTIREIPELLTEYRFWFLMYLCSLYLYIIKSLLKPNNTNELLIKIIDTLYKPLYILDHLIKYNKFLKDVYLKYMTKFIELLTKLNNQQLLIISIIFQIIPRLILITFLTQDVFYYNKIELFYKVILIGLLPFIYKYVKYSIKDFKEFYISSLENSYEFVTFFDKAYMDPSIEWESNNSNNLHNKDVSIKEYINFKINKEITNYPDTDYAFTVYMREHIYKEYQLIHNTKEINDNDLVNLRKDFNTLTPKIILISLFLERYSNINENNIIKYSKIIIFLTYLICWSFVLIISYCHYPIELLMFKLFIINFLLYLCIAEEPFSSLLI